MKKSINIYYLLLIITTALHSVEILPLDINGSASDTVVDREMKYYKIIAKASETITVKVSNVNGDPDLFLKLGDIPQLDNFTKSSENSPTEDENLEITVEEDTDVYIGIYGYPNGFSEASYTLSVESATKVSKLIYSDETIDAQINFHEMMYYRIIGKAGDQIDVTLSDIVNDPDLYLKVGAKPTIYDYTKISDNSPNLNENITITLENNEDVYIGVYGYNGYPNAKYKLKVKIISIQEEIQKKVYEDAETSGIIQWNIVDNFPAGAEIDNVYDAEKKSRVIVLDNPNTSESEANGYQLGIAWNNSYMFNIKWDMKTTESYIIDVFITTQNGAKVLRYSDYDETYTEFGGELVYGLGKASVDGEWHSYNRNLEKDLAQAEINNKILSVDKLVVRAKASFDNIELYAHASKVYENAENGATNKWNLYSNVGNLNNILNEDDADRGNKVISFNSLDITHKYIIGGELNATLAWNDLAHQNVKWSMKHIADGFVRFIVNTTKGVRYINYNNQNISFKNLNQNELTYGLGVSSNNGFWHTYIRNLATDIKTLEPDNILLSIEGMIVSGKIKIDDLELFYIAYPSAHGSGWSLTFDDATVAHWFSFRNKFLEYNIKPTFFVSHFLYLDNEDIGQLKILEEDGAEIGCHTLDHGGIARDYNNDPNRIQEYLNEQIIPVYNAMKAEGFNLLSFAHPYGETDKLYDEALRTYFPYLRGLSESKGRYVQRDNLFLKKGNPYNLLVADTIDNGYRDLEQIRESMIRARENDEIFSLYGHDIVDNYIDYYKLPPDELEKIIIISKEVGLKSFTYKEAYLFGKI